MKLSFFILLLATIVCYQTTAYSQSLYMPRNVQESFEKGVRSPDGRPGAHYWQNHGRYDITLTALPPDRTIRGSEKITYFNESPDTLHSVVFRLVLNFHKPEALHYIDMDSTRFTTGLHVDRFAINGQPVTWNDPQGHFTWQTVPLPQPLLPGDSVRFSVDWHNEIARKSDREGRIDSTTYYLAYFYPRISVFDDYNGWDRLDFTGYQEFYNDFNNYTLRVRVPEHYMVWATGVLQNAGQVLQPAYARRLAASMHSDSVFHIAAPGDWQAKKVTAHQPVNTWIWTAEDVTDMAIGISDHYNWDAGSVVVDDKTGRRASVQAAYNDTSADYHHAVAFGKQALHWFSRHWPGVPYPYPKMTAFQGYADMEYPMMVNDASEPDLKFSQLVENHEIAHTYFPFYMGTNESRYAFMDEGWATTFELLIARAQQSVREADSFYKVFRVNSWINQASQEVQVPIITPANIERGLAYGANAYGKPSLGYLALKDLLGDTVFGKCLHAYMDRWHGKHPIPWDFFNTFNDVSGENLDWFWNAWFFSHGYNDLGIGGVKKRPDGYLLTIKNTGGFPIPFDVLVNYSDGTTGTLHETPVVWMRHPAQTVMTFKTQKEVASLMIDTGIWVDAHPQDNTWKAGH